MRYQIEVRLALVQLRWSLIAGALAVVLAILFYPSWSLGIAVGVLSIALSIGIVIPMYLTVLNDVSSAPQVQFVASIIKLAATPIFALGATYLLSVPTNAVAIGLTVGLVSAIVSVIVTVYTDPRFPGSTTSRARHNTPMSGKAV